MLNPRSEAAASRSPAVAAPPANTSAGAPVEPPLRRNGELKRTTSQLEVHGERVSTAGSSRPTSQAGRPSSRPRLPPSAGSEREPSSHSERLGGPVAAGEAPPRHPPSVALKAARALRSLGKGGGSAAAVAPLEAKRTHPDAATGALSLLTPSPRRPHAVTFPSAVTGGAQHQDGRAPPTTSRPSLPAVSRHVTRRLASSRGSAHAPASGQALPLLKSLSGLRRTPPPLPPATASTNESEAISRGDAGPSDPSHVPRQPSTHNVKSSRAPSPHLVASLPRGQCEAGRSVLPVPTGDAAAAGPSLPPHGVRDAFGGSGGASLPPATVASGMPSSLKAPSSPLSETLASFTRSVEAARGGAAGAANRPALLARARPHGLASAMEVKETDAGTSPPACPARPEGGSTAFLTDLSVGGRTPAADEGVLPFPPGHGSCPDCGAVNPIDGSEASNAPRPHGEEEETDVAAAGEPHALPENPEELWAHFERVAEEEKARAARPTKPGAPSLLSVTLPPLESSSDTDSDEKQPHLRLADPDRLPCGSTSYELFTRLLDRECDSVRSRLTGLDVTRFMRGTPQAGRFMVLFFWFVVVRCRRVSEERLLVGRYEKLLASYQELFPRGGRQEALPTVQDTAALAVELRHCRVLYDRLVRRLRSEGSALSEHHGEPSPGPLDISSHAASLSATTASVPPAGDAAVPSVKQFVTAQHQCNGYYASMLRHLAGIVTHGNGMLPGEAETEHFAQCVALFGAAAAEYTWLVAREEAIFADLAALFGHVFLHLGQDARRARTTAVQNAPQASAPSPSGDKESTASAAATATGARMASSPALSVADSVDSGKDTIIESFATITVHATYYTLLYCFPNDAHAGLFRTAFRADLLRLLQYWFSGIIVTHVPVRGWPVPTAQDRRDDDQHFASTSPAGQPSLQGLRAPPQAEGDVSSGIGVLASPKSDNKASCSPIHGRDRHASIVGLVVNPGHPAEDAAAAGAAGEGVAGLSPGRRHSAVMDIASLREEQEQHSRFRSRGLTSATTQARTRDMPRTHSFRHRIITATTASSRGERPSLSSRRESSTAYGSPLIGPKRKRGPRAAVARARQALEPLSDNDYFDDIDVSVANGEHRLAHEFYRYTNHADALLTELQRRTSRQHRRQLRKLEGKHGLPLSRKAAAEGPSAAVPLLHKRAEGRRSNASGALGLSRGGGKATAEELDVSITLPPAAFRTPKASGGPPRQSGGSLHPRTPYSPHESSSRVDEAREPRNAEAARSVHEPSAADVTGGRSPPTDAPDAMGSSPSLSLSREGGARDLLLAVLHPPDTSSLSPLLDPETRDAGKEHGTTTARLVRASPAGASSGLSDAPPHVDGRTASLPTAVGLPAQSSKCKGTDPSTPTTVEPCAHPARFAPTGTARILKTARGASAVTASSRRTSLSTISPFLTAAHSTRHRPTASTAHSQRVSESTSIGATTAHTERAGRRAATLKGRRRQLERARERLLSSVGRPGQDGGRRAITASSAPVQDDIPRGGGASPRDTASLARLVHATGGGKSAPSLLALAETLQRGRCRGEQPRRASQEERRVDEGMQAGQASLLTSYPFASCSKDARQYLCSTAGLRLPCVPIPITHPAAKIAADLLHAQQQRLRKRQRRRQQQHRQGTRSFAGSWAGRSEAPRVLLIDTSVNDGVVVVSSTISSEVARTALSPPHGADNVRLKASASTACTGSHAAAGFTAAQLGHPVTDSAAAGDGTAVTFAKHTLSQPMTAASAAAAGQTGKRAADATKAAPVDDAAEERRKHMAAHMADRKALHGGVQRVALPTASPFMVQYAATALGLTLADGSTGTTGSGGGGMREGGVTARGDVSGNRMGGSLPATAALTEKTIAAHSVGARQPHGIAGENGDLPLLAVSSAASAATAAPTTTAQSLSSRHGDGVLPASRSTKGLGRSTEVETHMTILPRECGLPRPPLYGPLKRAALEQQESLHKEMKQIAAANALSQNQYIADHLGHMSRMAYATSQKAAQKFKRQAKQRLELSDNNKDPRDSTPL